MGAFSENIKRKNVAQIFRLCDGETIFKGRVSRHTDVLGAKRNQVTKMFGDLCTERLPVYYADATSISKSRDSYLLLLAAVGPPALPGA